MGMYSAMMKQVHDRAKELEKAGQLDRIFQKQEPAQQKQQEPVRKQSGK